MTIRVSAPGGANIEFPDGTDHDTISAVLDQMHGGTAPSNAPGALQSLAEGAGQGLTFGTSDELEGAARAGIQKLQGSPKPFSDLYSEGVAAPRARQEAERSAHPYAYYGGEIGGSIAVPFGAEGLGLRAGVKMASEAPLLARTAIGAGEGAGYGAAYGYGQGEGGVQNRASGALAGAEGGAVLGAVAPGAVDLASNALGRVTRPIRALSAPNEVADEKILQTIGRDGGNSGNVAGLRIGLDALDARAAGAIGAGKPMVMADFMGDNGRKLLRSAMNMPNDRRAAFNDFLNQRQTGQWSRLESDLAHGLGSPDDYKASVDQIAAVRGANASKDFQSAYSQPWNVKGDDPLVSLLQRPYMQRLLQKTSDKISGVTGENPDALSPWEFLHRTRMQIGNEIGNLKRGQPDPVSNWDAKDLTTLKGQLTTEISKHNPQFKTAIDNYAGDSDLKDAATEGFDEALKIPTEDLAQKMRSFSSTSEADMYRMGAARAIAQKVRTGDVMRDRVKGVFSSPDMDLRLRALFPNGGLSEFKNSLDLEGKAYGTRAAVQGNSTTASQLAEGDEAAQPARALDAIGNIAVGNYAKPLLNALSRGAQRFSGLTPDVAGAMVNRFAQPAGRGTTPIRNALSGAIAHAQQVPQSRAQLVDALIAGYGGISGRLMGPDAPQYDDGPYAPQRRVNALSR